MHSWQGVQPQMCPKVLVKNCVLILFGLLCLFIAMSMMAKLTVGILFIAQSRL